MTESSVDRLEKILKLCPRKHPISAGQRPTVLREKLSKIENPKSPDPDNRTLDAVIGVQALPPSQSQPTRYYQP